MNLKGFHALQTYRIAHHLSHAGRPEIASLVFGPDIHPEIPAQTMEQTL